MALSKEQIPEFEEYMDKKMLNVVENLDSKSVMDYVRYRHRDAISIDAIHGILGGANMTYDCTEADQALAVFEICKQFLLKTLKETNRKIFYFHEQCYEQDKAVVAITLRPKTAQKRSHLILWACMWIEIREAVTVSFVRSFDLAGMSCFTFF